MLELTISSDAPHFSQEHLVFGKHYTLELEWIEREQYWVMHLYGVHEEAIALGLRVMPYWPIYIDKDAMIAFLLIAKTGFTPLTLNSLHREFRLVACEII